MTQDKKGLIGLTAATKALELALHIPCLADEKPLGFMFVAQPGTGKSFLLTRFHSDNMLVVNDITGRGLENVIEKMQKYKQGYVNIPDLLKVMSRSKGWDAFLTLSNVLLEEGVSAISRYDKFIVFDEPVNFGIVTAMTNDVFERHKKNFEALGFLSRFGIFAFDYEKEDENRILKDLALGKTQEELKYYIEVESEPKFVKIPSETGLKMQSLAKMLSNGKHKPFRAINFIRRLCKANAVINKRDTVTDEDIRQVYALIPFFIPPEPLSTDLEYFILMKDKNTKWEEWKEMLKEKYDEESIYNARQRLIQKQLLKPKN
jgi:hypothetical protein